MACAGMVAGFVMFWLGAHPSWLFATIVATFFLGSAIYVVSRPTLVGKP